VRTGSSSSYRNSSWDDNPDLFGLQRGWDVGRAFVMRAALTVLLPGYQNVGRDSNRDVGGPFRYLSYFLSFTALITLSV
jgi:hypothetical protein